MKVGEMPMVSVVRKLVTTEASREAGTGMEGCWKTSVTEVGDCALLKAAKRAMGWRRTEGTVKDIMAAEAPFGDFQILKDAKLEDSKVLIVFWGNSMALL